MARTPVPSEALGLHIIGPQEDPQVHSECVRVARRIRLCGKRVVGLLPGAQRVAIPPIAVQLAAALIALEGGPVAYVDANLRWPGAPAPEFAPHGPIDPFVLGWLGQPTMGLGILSPSEPGPAGSSAFELKSLLEKVRDQFSHILVDLTGFERLGEHMAAARLVDGVVVVARMGNTREQQLVKLREEIADILGVVLIGT